MSSKKSDLSKLVVQGRKRKVSVSILAGPIGRPRSAHPRKSSHVPLRDDERAKLGKAARLLGLPYATWARMTLLLVADWPEDKQPIRGFGPQAKVFEEGDISSAVRKGQVSVLGALGNGFGKDAG